MSRRCLIVVPCYNEAARLDPEVWLAFASRNPEIGFLFVDDGSTDETKARLASLCHKEPAAMAVLELSRNRGKAEAVRQGMIKALERRPFYIGYWDADLATPLETIPLFADLLDRNESIQLVMGSRVRMLGHTIQRSAIRHGLGRVFAVAAAWTLGLPVYDTQCGAKLFRATPAIESLFARPFRTNWTFDVEVLARLINETDTPPEAIHEHPLPEWRDVAGSKVRPWDFFRAFVGLATISWETRGAKQRPRDRKTKIPAWRTDPAKPRT